MVLSKSARTTPIPLVAFPWGSPSMSKVRRSATARLAARFTAVVVLPTPPFWLAMAMTRATGMFAGVGGRGNDRPRRSCLELRLFRRLHNVARRSWCARRLACVLVPRGTPNGLRRTCHVAHKKAEPGLRALPMSTHLEWNAPSDLGNLTDPARTASEP